MVRNKNGRFSAIIITMAIAGTVSAAPSAYGQTECDTVLACAQAAVEAARDAETSAANAIPLGAILAFRNECPSGWSEVQELAGRVILGAGLGNTDEVGRALTERRPGTTGGEEAHVLTVDEMPSHQHLEASYSGADGDRTSRGDSLYAATRGWTDPAGGGAAHNNMPPFFVLMYCEKMN